ncbi:MAG: DNA cytosine methyltransferase [Deltaproteobacteria bacterium]|nr:DNA cytosine methyltransferase [Deltaproteobacteria bacterium]
MENKDKIILQLCCDQGSDTIFYRENGYDVRLITKEIGVENYHPPGNVYGIIANPPCTHFSFARTRAKTPRDLKEGMRLVKECLRIIWECQYKLESDHQRTSSLKFWALENPSTGLLKWFLGKPRYIYCPSEFGAPHTKQTALWGNFNAPAKPLFLNEQKTKRLVSQLTGGTSIKKSECYLEFAKHFYYNNK